MTYDGELPPYVTTEVNGVVRSYPAYRYREEIPEAFVGQAAIPEDNDGEYTTSGKAILRVGGDASARPPSVFVMGQLPGAYAGHASFPNEYASFTHPPTGFIGLTWAVFLAFLIRVIILVALVAVAFHLIEVSYSTSVTPTGTDPEGNPLYTICTGNILSRDCVIFNPATGQTYDGPGVSDWMPLAIGLVVLGVGGYIALKFIGKGSAKQGVTYIMGAGKP